MAAIAIIILVLIVFCAFKQIPQTITEKIEGSRRKTEEKLAAIEEQARWINKQVCNLQNEFAQRETSV